MQQGGWAVIGADLGQEPRLGTADQAWVRADAGEPHLGLALETGGGSWEGDQLRHVKLKVLQE